MRQNQFVHFSVNQFIAFEFDVSQKVGHPVKITAIK